MVIKFKSIDDKFEAFNNECYKTNIKTNNDIETVKRDISEINKMIDDKINSSNDKLSKDIINNNKSVESKFSD